VRVKKRARLIRTQKQTREAYFRHRDTSLTDWYQAASLRVTSKGHLQDRHLNVKCALLLSRRDNSVDETCLTPFTTLPNSYLEEKRSQTLLVAGSALNRLDGW